MEDIVYGVVTGAILLSFILATLRLMRGPSVPDRVIALDLMASIAAGWTALEAMRAQEVALLRVGMLLALVGFLTTAGFAFYLERVESDHGD